MRLRYANVYGWKQQQQQKQQQRKSRIKIYFLFQSMILYLFSFLFFCFPTMKIDFPSAKLLIKNSFFLSQKETSNSCRKILNSFGSFDVWRMFPKVDLRLILFLSMLFVRAFGLNCPNKFKYVSLARECFYVSKVATTFGEAFRSCAKNGKNPSLIFVVFMGWGIGSFRCVHASLWESPPVRPSVRPERGFFMSRLWEKMIGND